MDFGKLKNVDRVDFRLPPPPAPQEARTLQILAQARKSPDAPRAAEVRVGAPIWSQRNWVGQVYPVGAKPGDFLHHYSRQFNTIELNVTHYRIPTPEAVVEWREVTPPGFKFCPKWPQEISHHHALRGCEAQTAQFCDSLSRLEDRLGPSFLQLHPGFGLPQLPVLRDFLAALPPSFPISVEFRHESWFKDHALVPAALDALEEARAGTVITDVAGRRDVAHLSLTVPRALIRFVCNEGHPSDEARMREWVERLALWLSSGLRELDFCVHQPDNVGEPATIREFIELLNARAGTAVVPWKPMNQGTQLALF